MRVMFVALLLLLAGCADAGEEPVQETEDPVADEGTGPAPDAGNETDEPGSDENATEDAGNTTTPQNGTVDGNTTEPADNGTADGNATTALEPWTGGCTVSFAGVRSGGNTVTLNSADCSTTGTDAVGFTSLHLKSEGSFIAYGDGLSLQVSGPGGVLATMSTGSGATGEESFALQGTDDVTSLSFALTGTFVGDGDLSYSVTLS